MRVPRLEQNSQGCADPIWNGAISYGKRDLRAPPPTLTPFSQLETTLGAAIHLTVDLMFAELHVYVSLIGQLVPCKVGGRLNPLQPTYCGPNQNCATSSWRPESPVWRARCLSSWWPLSKCELALSEPSWCKGGDTHWS